MKAKEQVDFRRYVETQRRKNETMIMLRAMEHYGVDMMTGADVTLRAEKVRHYSVGVCTMRWRGKLIFRRFPLDLEGFSFRYESPIFNNTSTDEQ